MIGNAGAIARLSGIDRVAALPSVPDPHVAPPALGEVLSWVLPPWTAPREPVA